MLFKICGLKKIETINCCEKNNVNFFGMIFYKKSPRFVSIKEDEILVDNSIIKNIMPVGVFVNEEIKTVLSFIKKLNLKTIQLHGLESNEYIKSIIEKLLADYSNSSGVPLFQGIHLDYLKNKGNKKCISENY